MTEASRLMLDEMDDLLDRFEFLSPKELARLNELDVWNCEEMKRLGVPVDAINVLLCGEP